MFGLSQKSQALTNTLMPRSPIPHKVKKYAQHSQYGHDAAKVNLGRKLQHLP